MENSLLEKLTIDLPGFSLPPSKFLSQETLAGLAKGVDDEQDLLAIIERAGEVKKDVSSDAIETNRLDQAEGFYQSAWYQSLIAQYSTRVSTEIIAGVTVEIFTPEAGVSAVNSQRVLLHCHGGGFETGARTFSHLEAIPVSALGNIKVISVDYRMAPIHHFPAATDDVVAVYQALLHDYLPENIGIFGASAGAILSAQALVRLQQKNMPLPAAVGMIAAGAAPFVGDSVEWMSSVFYAKKNIDLKKFLQLDYYAEADLENPELMPIFSNQFMSAFPPSLLATSTRDFQLSNVLATHRQLIELGVEAELHVWEGLDHAFHYNPRLSESESLNRMVIRFFEKYLGGDTEST